MNVLRRVGIMGAILFLIVGALSACGPSKTIDPVTGVEQLSPSDEAFASFQAEVTSGVVTPTRGEGNTLVYKGQKEVNGIVYDCLIIESSSDGSVLQKAQSMFKSTVASATQDGCVRHLEPAKPAPETRTEAPAKTGSGRIPFEGAFLPEVKKKFRGY